MDVPVAANVLGTMGAVRGAKSCNDGFANQTRFVGLFRCVLAHSWLWSSSLPIILKAAQLIPQIVVNYRRHNATGLQPTMMMLWAWAGVPLGVYNIAENYNVALRIQPQILTTLSLITWIQCYYYEKVT